MFPIALSIFINYQSHISDKRQIILILVMRKQLRDFYPRLI